LQKDSSQGRIFWAFASGYREDVMGPFVNRNQFAAWVELLFPAALWLALTEPRRRVLYVSGAAILFGSVATSASRAGLALVLVEALAVVAAALIGGRIGRRALINGVIIFGGLAVLVTAVAGWQEVARRLR